MYSSHQSFTLSTFEQHNGNTIGDFDSLAHRWHKSIVVGSSKHGCICRSDSGSIVSSSGAGVVVWKRLMPWRWRFSGLHWPVFMLSMQSSINMQNIVTYLTWKKTKKNFIKILLEFFFWIIVVSFIQTKLDEYCNRWGYQIASYKKALFDNENLIN